MLTDMYALSTPAYLEIVEDSHVGAVVLYPRMLLDNATLLRLRERHNVRITT